MKTPSRETILARDLTRSHELDPKLSAADVRTMGRDDYYLTAADALARLYGRQRTVAVVTEARKVMASW